MKRACHVIGHQDLGVTSIERNGASKPWDSHHPCRSRQFKLVVDVALSRIVCVSNNVEIGRVANERCCCYVLRVRVCPVGLVMGYGSQVLWRNAEEVSLELHLAVFLPHHCAILPDRRPIVVRGISVGKSEITPIGATVEHIEINVVDPKGVVIFIKNSFKFFVSHDGTFRESRAGP